MMMMVMVMVLLVGVTVSRIEANKIKYVTITSIHCILIFLK